MAERPLSSLAFTRDGSTLRLRDFLFGARLRLSTQASGKSADPPSTMIDPIGVPRAQQAALGGIQRSQSRLDQAAADVAHDGVVQNEAARVTFSNEARELARASGSTPSPLGGERPRHDLPEALVDSMVAEHEMAANVKVLQTTDELEKTLMAIKR